MNSELPWLPATMNFNDYDGDWERFLSAIYGRFYQDFRQSRIFFQSKPVAFDKTISSGKEAAFWHVISSDDPHGSRLPDLRRCERIAWCRAIIENSSNQDVSMWKNKRGGETRVMLWLEKTDYLVVLSEQKDKYFLVTAYCTNRPHTRAKLIKERDSAP